MAVQVAIIFVLASLLQATPPPPTMIPNYPNLPPIDVPAGARGTAADPNGPTGRPPGTPGDAAASRMDQDRMDQIDFRDNSIKLYALTGEIATIGSRPADAQTQREIRKKAEGIDKRLNEMIRYLGGHKPKSEKPPPGALAVSLPGTVRELASALNQLRPNLTKFLQSQSNVVDLQLSKAILGQLETARLVARRLSGN